MPQFVPAVQPPLKFLPQALNPLVLNVVKVLLPAWLKYRLSIQAVRTENANILVELYQKFQAGQVRLLFAFRHPSTSDPFIMAHLLWYAVPRAARQQGVTFSAPIRSYFMYDRGIPLWAGNFVTWLFPRLGGTPILRGKADREGLRAARNLMANGEIPLSVAPEGGTNEHCELISPLEPGVAQLGFWCVDDLRKAGRDEAVYIVPIDLHYQYVNPPWAQLSVLLTELEGAVNISEQAKPIGLIENPQADVLYSRLLRLSEKLLEVIENFYTRSYHRQVSVEIVDSHPEPSSPKSNQALLKRLQATLEVALQVAEEHFGITAKGNFADRCRKLEQAIWDRIYRDDLAPLSPLEKGLANWLAQEASLQQGHLRLVERLASMTGDYILERPTADRFADVIVILWRTVNYIRGANPHQPLKLGPRTVHITIDEPISVSDRWPNYKKNRRQARQEITDLTEAIHASLQRMIDKNIAAG